MSEEEHQERLLDAIDNLRRRKARPDESRICRYLFSNHKISFNDSKAALEKLLDSEQVIKVEYKGQTSYRNAAKWTMRFSFKNKKEVEFNFSTIVYRTVAELLLLDPNYLDNGVPVDVILKTVTRKSRRATKEVLESILQDEFASGSLIKMDNGNVFVGEAVPDFSNYEKTKEASNKTSSKVEEEIEDFSTLMSRTVEEMILTDKNYSEKGVPLTDLHKHLTLTKYRFMMRNLEKMVDNEVKSGSLVRLLNGNVSTKCDKPNCSEISKINEIIIPSRQSRSKSKKGLKVTFDLETSKTDNTSVPSTQSLSQSKKELEISMYHSNLLCGTVATIILSDDSYLDTGVPFNILDEYIRKEDDCFTKDFLTLALEHELKVGTLTKMENGNIFVGEAVPNYDNNSEKNKKTSPEKTTTEEIPNCEDENKEEDEIVIPGLTDSLSVPVKKLAATTKPVTNKRKRTVNAQNSGRTRSSKVRRK